MTDDPAGPSLREVCEAFLDKLGWDYALVDAGEPGRLRFGLTGEVVRLECWLSVYEATQRVCLLGVYNLHVPEEKRLAVAEYVVRANWEILIGGFELNMGDGQIHFKNSADVEGVELTHRFLMNLVAVSQVTADKYFPGLMKVIYAGVTPEDAIAIVRASH